MSITRSLPCSSPSDAETLRNYITTYASHPNQLIYNGRVLASTFSGESCKFGQDSVQSGWSTQFLQQLSGENAVHFIPSFFVDTSAFQSFNGVIDGMLNVRVMIFCCDYHSNSFFQFSGTPDGLYKLKQVRYRILKALNSVPLQNTSGLPLPTKSISTH